MPRHSPIRVGDLVIAERATFFQEYNSCLAVVIGSLAHRRSLDLGTMQWSVGLCYCLRLLVPEERVVHAAPRSNACVIEMRELSRKCALTGKWADRR